MKYSDLKEDYWYTGKTGFKWTFKFDKLNKQGDVCSQKCGTAFDGYVSKSGGHFSNIKEIKCADIKDVFKLFPNEKEILIDNSLEYEIY